MGKLEDRMRYLFELSYGPVHPRAWGVKLRRKFDYFTPDEHYEAAVEDIVGNLTEWLDVGGGNTIFPSNPNLSRLLSERCKRMVVVDPSANVLDNTLALERHQCLLEDYEGEGVFNLVTARMVVEHVTHPKAFVAKLGQLTAPGGKVVIYTVSRWAPMTILSSLTPTGFHHLIKQVLWRTREEDTFPVAYLMNSETRLRMLFSAAGFRCTSFQRLDDCRTLARWRVTHYAELLGRWLLRGIGLGYPEACILGVYERV